jgi:hypothetical protein
MNLGGLLMEKSGKDQEKVVAPGERRKAGISLFLGLVLTIGIPAVLAVAGGEVNSGGLLVEKSGKNREKVVAPGETRETGISLPLGLVLAFGIPIVLAVAGGVFKLTTFSTQQHVNALQMQLEAAKVSLAGTSESTSTIAVNQLLPDVTRKAAKDVRSVDALAQKLAAVERERDALIQDLSQNALGSLDPNSELPVLLNELRSGEQKVRIHALDGLFVLRDRRSFAYLAAHFKSHMDDVDGTEHGWGPWYSLLIDLDPHAGIEMVVGELDSERYLRSSVAYDALNAKIKTVELIDIAKPCLESFALRSQNSFARTRAKVFLDRLAQRRSEMEQGKANGGDNDNRSLYEVLLNIEKVVLKLADTDPNTPHAASGSKD